MVSDDLYDLDSFRPSRGMIMRLMNGEDDPDPILVKVADVVNNGRGSFTLTTEPLPE